MNNLTNGEKTEILGQMFLNIFQFYISPFFITKKI